MVAAVVGVLCAGSSVAVAQTWTQRSWVALSTGHESDRLLDRASAPVEIPGDYFVGLQPGIIVYRPLGTRGRVMFDGLATIERFYSDENRILFGATGNVELARRFGSRWRWRTALGAGYVTDSANETLNRSSLDGELGVGLVGSRGYLEALAGVQGRHFPEVSTIDGSGRELLYGEIGGSVGAAGALRPARWVEVSGLVSGYRTRARDPNFDNRAFFTQGALRYTQLGPARVSATVVFQQRWFDDWSDTYAQQGIGVTYPIVTGLDASLRYTRAQYTSPFRASENIWRFTVALTWWPTGHREPFVPLVAPAAGPTVDARPLYAGQQRLFRVLAPEARGVSVVGDFNGWNPRVNPMEASDGGWWQVRVALPSGAHQYAYWVDGVLMTPPESEVTVDDGFGGKNGVVHVEPIRL